MCKNMSVCILDSTKANGYNELQSYYYKSFISVIPYAKLVCLFLDQILKLHRSNVQIILRLRP